MKMKREKGREKEGKNSVKEKKREGRQGVERGEKLVT